MSIEWAWSNEYHGIAKTKKFVNEYGMTKFKVSGCQFGLASIVNKTLGLPLCKAWGIWSNNPSLSFALDGPHVRCQGGHPSTKVEGESTAHSGVYPDDFAKYINTVMTTPISDLQNMAASGEWPIVGRR